MRDPVQIFAAMGLVIVFLFVIFILVKNDELRTGLGMLVGVSNEITSR